MSAGEEGRGGEREGAREEGEGEVMPTIDGKPTIFEVGDVWSVETGIKVLGMQESTAEEGGEFNTDILSELGEELNQDDFLDGRIRPTGVVILFVSKKNEVTLWELSPHSSAFWRSCGPEPGALASIRPQWRDAPCKQRANIPGE